MLNDIRDLLTEDDDLYPTEEESNRRKYYIIGGVIGGLLLLIIVCFGVYALVIGPGGADASLTATSIVSTQLAEVAEVPSATLESLTPTATPAPLTNTPEPSSTLEPTLTEPPTETQPPAEATSTPTLPPPPTTTPSLIFQENFEGSGGIWPTSVRENFEYGIVDGEFQIKVVSPFIEAWTVRERIFQEVRTEADMTIAPGTEDGYVGLVCQFQDGFNFYAGIINGEGEYAIVRRTGTELVELAGPEKSPQVLGSGDLNRIRFDCVGGELTLFINGSQLLNAVDESYTEGQVGLIAGTLTTTGLEAYFDNYIIARP